MKKFLTLTLALALALGLTACGGKKEEAWDSSDIQALVDAGAFSEELEELDADTAFLLYKLGDYGLTQDDVKECSVLRSAGATCEEGAVLVLSSGEKADSAVQALHAYIEGQIEANEDYRPAEIPKLQSVYICIKGDSVLMVVANDQIAARKALD